MLDDYIGKTVDADLQELVAHDPTAIADSDSTAIFDEHVREEGNTQNSIMYYGGYTADPKGIKVSANGKCCRWYIVIT